LLSIQTPLGNGLRRRKTVPSCNRVYDRSFETSIMIVNADFGLFRSLSSQEDQSESLPTTTRAITQIDHRELDFVQCDRKQPCSACLERDDESNCKLSEKDIAPKLTYVREHPVVPNTMPDSQAHPMLPLHFLLRCCPAQRLHPLIRLCDRLQSLKTTRKRRLPLA